MHYRIISLQYETFSQCSLNLKESGLIEIKNYEDRSFYTSSKGKEFIKKFYYLMQQAGDLTE